MPRTAELGRETAERQWTNIRQGEVHIQIQTINLVAGRDNLVEIFKSG